MHINWMCEKSFRIHIVGFLITLPLIFLPEMSFFVSTSIVSTVIVLGVGILLTTYHVHLFITNGVDETVNYLDYTQLGQYFGLIYFSLGEIGLVFPIRHAMKKPEQYKKAFMSTITLTTIAYLVFGICGCLAHGNTENEIILFIYDRSQPIIYTCGFLYSIVHIVLT